MQEGIKFIKKISTATLGFNMKDLRKLCEKSPASLFKVYGLATGVKYGSGDNGPWTKFTGQFEAINAQNGDITRSGEMFIPNSTTPILESQIISGKSGEKFAGVQFALEIGVVTSDLNIGYEYTVKSLLPENAENDLLVKMRNDHILKKITAKV